MTEFSKRIWAEVDALEARLAAEIDAALELTPLHDLKANRKNADRWAKNALAPLRAALEAEEPPS